MLKKRNRLNKKEYDWLSNKLAPNGMIFSFLDFDTTGRNGAKYLYDTYNIPYLFITRGEFGLYNYESKDFTELHDKFTYKEIDNFIKETIIYVELKYRTNNYTDTDADFSEIPYFV